jgi:SAM-dependent methyltransferase
MQTCPLCEVRSPRSFLCKVTLVPGTTHDLVECAHCGVIHFSPLPGVPELAGFYSAAYYDFDRSREEGKGMAFARRLRRWKPAGRFLDVGCATGFFLQGIRDHCAWDVYGTDVGESAVRFARERLHLDVRQGELADAAFPDAFFDYVHVNNVLEHVLRPAALLRECRRVIRPGGTLFLSVPNGYNDSRDLIAFHRIERQPARSKDGHIFFFPARTLLTLVERSGFSVQAKRTHGLKRGLRNVGCLPRKAGWKRDYFPRPIPGPAAPTEIGMPDPRKRHSDLYYRFRFALGNLQMIPGLHRFGLDFLLLLKPR